ncbi:MAG: lipocalin-like domain-containing protein [Muribaculaceae bacterium]
MKHIFSVIAILAILLMSNISCTHNNGDIGPLFGNWKVTTIEINDKIDHAYQGNLFFEFQNDVTGMKVVYDNHNVAESYGQWKLTDKKLLIIYDDKILPPLLESHMCQGTNICEVITLTNKNFKFRLVTPHDTYTYTCVKW